VSKMGNLVKLDLIYLYIYKIKYIRYQFSTTSMDYEFLGFVRYDVQMIYILIHFKNIKKLNIYIYILILIFQKYNYYFNKQTDLLVYYPFKY